MFVRNPRAGRVTLHLFEDQRRRFVLPTREQRHCAKLFMGIDHCGDPRQLAVLFDLGNPIAQIAPGKCAIARRPCYCGLPSSCSFAFH
jgi:hypothetical protein